MKKVTLYTENAYLSPSGYYRLVQYFDQQEAIMHSALPDKIYTWWHNRGRFGRIIFAAFLYFIYYIRTLHSLIRDYFTFKHGTIIISRVLIPHYLPSLHKCFIKKLAKHNKIIWDFDDNILENKSCSAKDFLFYSKYSDKIIVTSDILKSLIAPDYLNKVLLLPTTDGDMLSFDTDKYTEERFLLYSKEIRLIWVATASGMDFLRSIIPLLENTAKELREDFSKKLSLHVVCNKPLQYNTSYLEIVNIKWEREIAKQEIAKAHIGIMPLPDTIFTRGKGGFKLVQYLSVSLPVIGSDVGFNSQIITSDVGFLVNKNNEIGWKEAIMRLSTDWENYLKTSHNAKQHYYQNFSYNINKTVWKEITET